MKDKDISTQIDRLYSEDQAIKELEKELNLLKKEREVRKKRILRLLEREALTSVKGKRAAVTVSSLKILKIQNRAAFNKYVQKYDAWDLYPNRVNSKAYFDRAMLKDYVPGVEVVEVPRLLLRGIKE